MVITLYEGEENNLLEEEVELLKLMAHPVRINIVNELIKYKKLNVTQITQILKIPQSTTSQHLSKLKKTILRADRRGLEVYYSVKNIRAHKIIEILKHTQ
ncbi:metalloregulator ArsR/SmtB family transcription factor [Bacillus tropicus]|nr:MULTISPECIES: metalloregulator ArsR/SmtB family transcription factor [Bacillus cereus group]PFB77088.1 transcriptional regulator [Bacillus thuringiensis]TKH22257.1 helix-turn-helix transcriptional regulator [Bacillus cereus]